MQKYLDITTDDYKIPLMPESEIVDHGAGNNDIHDVNLEKTRTIEQNLKRGNRFLSNNPFFNKKELITKHADHFSITTLFKLG